MNTPYPITLSDQTIAEFRAKGFVRTDDVLSQEEIERFGAAVDREVAERTADDGRSLDEKSRYEQSFIQCMRLWETCPEVLPLSCHAGLAGIAAQLLGVDSVRMWQDQALYKEPGGKETTPHQDETFWAIGEEPLVSAWIPFDDVTRDSGAMAYVPGSHHAGMLKVVDITHRSEPYAILKDPALQGRRPEVVQVRAGSVIWHHGLTVHQASANRTDRTRRVFTVVYIASNARRIQSWPTYPLDREGIEVGEVLRGDSMPVLWPAVDEFPMPPEVIGEKTGPQHRLSRSDDH
jgi:ectoine hydroxylase-related dioxygenase (phytanoyl-CoA dioxygenase family)